MATIVKEVQEAFDLFDKNKDGTISVSELREAMKLAGHDVSEEVVKSLLSTHDKDENGVLTIDEFGTFLKSDNSVNYKEVREAFDSFDENGDGYISRNELVLAMKKVGENLSEVEIDSMIRNADINKDGKVSFEEFKRMMTPK
ncbi:calmodulin-4-like [Xenia sp. Carnegie-2017]|uniref:calmodulin-4-like n=1 Tax=Xenia sp. Carnegie-2017 TaxID=2897299 RepID=UPI001F0453B4|nr:calmodulin-4-like [Xenia sp. Carnegie-2017]